MRALVGVALGLALAAAPLSATDTYPRQPGVDVQHYALARATHAGELRRCTVRYHVKR